MLVITVLATYKQYKNQRKFVWLVITKLKKLHKYLRCLHPKTPPNKNVRIDKKLFIVLKINNKVQSCKTTSIKNISLPKNFKHQLFFVIEYIIHFYYKRIALAVV